MANSDALIIKLILLIDKKLCEQDNFISNNDILETAIKEGHVLKEHLEKDAYSRINIEQRLKDAKKKIRELLKKQKIDFEELQDNHDKRKILFRYPAIIREKIKAGELDLVADFRNNHPRFRDKQLKEMLAASKGLLPDRLYSELSLCEMQKQTKKKIVEFSGNDNLKNIELLPLIFRSIRDEKVISFEYKPFGKAKRHVKLHPHFLKQFNNRWFVFGYAIQNDGEYKSNPYPLDRILSSTIKVIKEKYITAEEIGIDYNTYFDDIVGVSHRRNANDEDIIIQTNDFYTHERILSKPICANRQIELESFNKEKQYGKIKLRLKPNLELRSILLGFGSHITILAPEKMKEEIKKELKKMISNYNGM